MRIFVVWDLVSPRVRALLSGLPTAITQIPSTDPAQGNVPIEWEIVSPDTSARPVARSVIWRGIQQADRVLVLFDGEKPDASIGWKVGLALGWHKPVHAACCNAFVPGWAKQSALSALQMGAVRDSVGVANLLRRQPVGLPAPEPQRALPSGIHNVGAIHDPGSLVLCPSGAAARALHDNADDLLLGCMFLPDEGLRLSELPKLLKERSGVVWVLAPDDHGEAINTAHAMVAGMAEASGCDVTVLRAAETPAVVDVQPRELGFRSVAEFRQKLMPSRPPPEVLPPPASAAGSGLVPETSGNIVVAPQVLADIEPGHTPPAVSVDPSSEEQSLDKYRNRRIHILLALAALAMAIAGLLALRGTSSSSSPDSSSGDLHAPRPNQPN